MSAPQGNARRRQRATTAFEKSFGCAGFGAMAGQLITGMWLANRWLGGWTRIFSEPTHSTHRVLIKLGLVFATLVVGGYAYHRVLPGLASGPAGLRKLAIHARVTMLLAVGLMVVGASIRLDSPV